MTDTVEAKDLEVKTGNMQTNSALPPEETERLGGEIVAALKTVFDPEIPADIYELGLIYKVDFKDDPSVDVVNVNLVWDPAWTPDRMSDEARLVLNMW